LAVPFHSFREELLDEFFAVVVSGFDDPTRVYEQLIHYGETRPDALGARPLWTGMMARRAAPEVAATMRSWMDHVLRYSRRDQLSLPYVLSSSPVRWRGIELDNQTSRWHRWPPVGEDLDRRTDARHVRFEHTIQAPLSRLRELERAAAGVGRLGAGALDGPGGAEGSALGEGTAAIETLGTGELLSALEDASLELTTVREELASAEAERDEAVARCDREHSVWERLVAERDQAEEAAIVAVRELEAAVARRDRAEANVEALHQTVAKVRREKREAVQNLKAKATRARTQTAQAKAELTRLKKSRAYKLARHAGGAMRALRGRRA
ncbi:MAG: hypothetical protein LBJ08_05275, partial [Bifidobacteriaceae bacterium]|jgi:hypothetical protein|nr:hypothetical protein [Bifidobacteriaceae bacterium]